MTHRMMPCISLLTLLTEVKKEYEEITFDELEDLLWFESPANDSYKEYYFGGGPIVEIYPNDKIINYIITLLESEFPQYDTILIDVSW